MKLERMKRISEILNMGRAMTALIKDDVDHSLTVFSMIPLVKERVEGLASDHGFLLADEITKEESPEFFVGKLHLLQKADAYEPNLKSYELTEVYTSRPSKKPTSKLNERHITFDEDAPMVKCCLYCQHCDYIDAWVGTVDTAGDLAEMRCSMRHFPNETEIEKMIDEGTFFEIAEDCKDFNLKETVVRFIEDKHVQPNPEKQLQKVFDEFIERAGTSNVGVPSKPVSVTKALKNWWRKVVKVFRASA